MPFVKQVKNKAYYKRFQVKYRRRREGKTDYYARKRLVTQAKNKYNSPKYRMVIRFTNSDIICQIVYAKIAGDFVFASAYAHELKNFGINIGLTNWAAAYCTGLLLARRVLTKLKLDKQYPGAETIDGTMYHVEAAEDGPRPFRAYADVGLRRTTTGSKVFGAVKGAADGGIAIPHGENRFPGYDEETKSLDASVLRKYIFGGHVAEYMTYLQDEDDEKYKRQFARYLAADIDPEQLEDLYAEVHSKIRANPNPPRKERKPLSKEDKIKLKKFKKQPMNLKQRKDRVRQKKEAYLKKLEAQE